MCVCVCKRVCEECVCVCVSCPGLSPTHTHFCVTNTQLHLHTLKYRHTHTQLKAGAFPPCFEMTVKEVNKRWQTVQQFNFCFTIVRDRYEAMCSFVTLW